MYITTGVHDPTIVLLTDARLAAECIAYKRTRKMLRVFINNRVLMSLRPPEAW